MAVPETACISIREAIEQDGFAIVEIMYSDESIQTAIKALQSTDGCSDSIRVRRGSAFAVRNVFDVVPTLRALATHAPLRTMIEESLGPDVFVNRAILFDKTSQANWVVPWHQDTTIAVRRRVDSPGFGPWSTKAGVVHVQPPPEVLTRILTARIHLDDCGKSNGALQILPGSHRFGILTEQVIEREKRKQPQTCAGQRGSVLFMRPLVLHSSSPASVASHRRILHLEFAAGDLPNGLEWHRA